MFFKNKIIYGVDKITEFLELRFTATVIDFRDYYGAPIFKSGGILCARKKEILEWRRKNPAVTEELENAAERPRAVIAAPKPLLTRWENKKT